MTDQPQGHPALTDSATRLPNELQFWTVFRYLFEGADRGVPLTLVLIDVEDAHDSVIPTAGHALWEATRAADMLAYLGNGRFAIVLLACNLHGARVAGDRVATILDGAVTAPFAVGIAAYHEDMKQPADLLEAAIQAQEKARQQGGRLSLGFA
ncbi:MAG: GGDEF domain-containing protein [Gemmatimonadota bacterium]|nr:GGDEF domain-containing protein [Gemmatimonadota bacterium]MDH5760319.1 GGDEF domain-containing protein [Gemmatimonadota bacterium]